MYLTDKEMKENLEQAMDDLSREQIAKNETVNRIRHLRSHLDGCARLIEGMDISEEPIVLMYMLDCFKSLMMAKAHLGAVMGGLGTPTPYQMDGNRHNINDIEEPSDQAGIFIVEGWSELNGVEQVDTLRQQLKDFRDNAFWNVYKNYDKEVGNTFSGRTLRAWWSAEQHIVEARFNLGFVLGGLRKSYNIPAI